MNPERLPLLGVLLPLRLDRPGAWQDLIDFLRCFGNAVVAPHTAKRPRTETPASRVVFYVGADFALDELEEEKASNHIEQLFERVLGVFKPRQLEFRVKTIQTSYPARQDDSCALRELARTAFSDVAHEPDLYLLASDDLRFNPCPDQGPGLLEEIASNFARFASNTHTPLYSMGSCCVLDETRPSEPSVPVIPRTHLEACGGDLIRFGANGVRSVRDLAFELHFRLGCGEILPIASCSRASSERELHLMEMARTMPLLVQSRMTNDSLELASDLGDEETTPSHASSRAWSTQALYSPSSDSFKSAATPPEAVPSPARMLKVCHPENSTTKWAHETLASFNEYLDHLHVNGILPGNFVPRIALDVVVPSFRTPREVLERIFSLPRCEKELAVRIIVVCDNPASEEAVDTFRQIAWDHRRDVACRMRVNQVNLGPGGTRNQGLSESAGDYVLFLDDDVLVEPVLLEEYARLIREWPLAAGFIGDTALPQPETPCQVGIVRSRICFGWDFARESPCDLGWGITANLCVKRNVAVRFDPEHFPKGGGGEDVDFCIRLAKLVLNQASVPQQPRKHLLPPSLSGLSGMWNELSTEALQTDLDFGGAENERGVARTRTLSSLEDVTIRRGSALSSISTTTFVSSPGESVLSLSEQNQAEHEAAIGLKFVPAPRAKVHHPWWDNGEPRFKHFIAWARGDRALVNQHPEHSFVSPPDAVEATLLLALLTPVFVWTGKASLRTMVLCMAAQPLGEFLYEIVSFRHADLIAKKGAPFALRTAYYSALAALAHEYGRFRGHVDRGVFFSRFCSHFNWYHGTAFRAQFKREERMRIVRRTLVRALTALAMYKAVQVISRVALRWARSLVSGFPRRTREVFEHFLFKRALLLWEA